MLVPYLDSSIPPKEDIMKSITDNERKKMDEFESIRGPSLDIFDRHPPLNQPSIVLDDFLFLGNMEHATNRELLERFQISKLFT